MKNRMCVCLFADMWRCVCARCTCLSMVVMFSLYVGPSHCCTLHRWVHMSAWSRLCPHRHSDVSHWCSSQNKSPPLYLWCSLILLCVIGCVAQHRTVFYPWYMAVPCETSTNSLIVGYCTLWKCSPVCFVQCWLIYYVIITHSLGPATAIRTQSHPLWMNFLIDTHLRSALCFPPLMGLGFGEGKLTLDLCLRTTALPVCEDETRPVVPYHR